MFRTPYLNIWNPICKRYQWVRPLNIFKDYQKNNYYYVVDITENGFCKCNLNKYIVVSDEQVFRYDRPSEMNGWVNKVKTFPEPELGKQNVYTKKYEGIDMLELYEKAVKCNPRYVQFKPPQFECKN